MPSRNDSNTTCTSHSNTQLDSSSSSSSSISVSVSRALSTVTSSASVAYGAAVIIASGAVIGGAYYWQYYWKHQQQHQRRRHDNDNGYTDGDDDDDDEVERLKDEIARLQHALKKVTRHYHSDSVPDDDVPAVLSTSSLSSASSVLSLHSTETPIEWRRCMLALTQFESGYQRRQRLNGTKKKKASGISRTPSQKRQEKTGGSSSILLSKFVPSTAATLHKATVCALLVARTLQHLPHLVADLQEDPHLILVILEAPNCGTSRALCAALPSLPHTRICVPQADPTHFLAMTTRNANDNNSNSSEGSMLLNLRAQRLDQWLVANKHGQLQVALFFADYETSIYGKPAVAFSPLRDIQGFFRLGYAAATSRTGAQQHQTPPHQCCLFGITLSFRPPHPSQCVTLDEYDDTLLDTDNNSTIAFDSTTEWVEDAVPVGPRLTPADLVGFIAAEAAAVVSFFLFLVEQQQQPTINKQKQQQNNRV